MDVLAGVGVLDVDDGAIADRVECEVDVGDGLSAKPSRVSQPCGAVGASEPSAMARRAAARSSRTAGSMTRDAVEPILPSSLIP